MLIQSNQQLSQQMMSIDQCLQTFFQMQQASGLGSQLQFTHHSQHNDDEDKDHDEEDDDPHLGD